MSWATFEINKLSRGETVHFCPRGKSMEPRVHDGQFVRVQPATVGDVAVGDVVLCVVGGNQFLHAVIDVTMQHGRPALALIANNRGTVNGWTSKVHGRLTATWAMTEGGAK